MTANPCDWLDCPNEASHIVRDAQVKPPGSLSEIEMGDIQLCAGHLQILERLGHLNLDWGRVLRMMETSR